MYETAKYKVMYRVGGQWQLYCFAESLKGCKKECEFLESIMPGDVKFLVAGKRDKACKDIVCMVS